MDETFSVLGPFHFLPYLKPRIALLPVKCIERQKAWFWISALDAQKE
jgi:hypothetical protein